MSTPKYKSGFFLDRENDNHFTLYFNGFKGEELDRAQTFQLFKAIYQGANFSPEEMAQLTQ